MAVTNKTASVLTKLKNQAKQQHISYQICLQLFVQEEFLRHLSASRYKENMVLKGGMFIYTLTEFESRPTRDIDFLARQFSNDTETVLKIMNEICSVDTENDFIQIETLGAEQITLDKKYPGVKTKFIGHIGNVRVPFSIDIGIDDVIVPGPILRSIATRLDGFEKPEIYTYSLESTIAEKIDSILQRMETTSRMKDFYDIYYLSEIFDFDGALLREAILSTSNHRGHEISMDVFSRIRDFPDNTFLQTQWKNFGPASNAGLAFGTAVSSLLIFIEPILLSIINEQAFDKQWTSSSKIWI